MKRPQHQRTTLATAAAIGFMVITMAIADSFGPDDFDLTWHSIDGGGGTSVGGDFELSGTIGQPDAASIAMAGGGFELQGGFWAGAAGPAPNTCPADIAPSGGDGVVGVPDLLAVISSWNCTGTPGQCLADIAPPGGDGVVGVPDLLKVISSWGVCPT